MIRKWVPRERVPKRVRVKDTADFFRVDYDDVVMLDSVPYFVRNNEREGRFGIDDEQKFWVKRARNLLTGDVKILKWVFKERFEARIGNLVFDCVRSPQKEARILELVRGRPDVHAGQDRARFRRQPAPHPGLHQGQDAGPDHARDWARTMRISSITTIPALLDEFIGIVEAIRFLHENNEKHGDIRRDHIIKDDATGHVPLDRLRFQLPPRREPLRLRPLRPRERPAVHYRPGRHHDLPARCARTRSSSTG